MSNDDDDWGDGADVAELGDQFNRFDPLKSVGGPPADKSVTKATPKPEFKSAAPSSLGSLKSPPSKAAPSSSTNSPTGVKSPPMLKAVFDQESDISAPRTFSQRFNQSADAGKNAFTAKLDDEALAHFNMISKLPFSEQAVAFLNAYWTEVGSQAEFIFSVAWEHMKRADMHAKGINYVHLYKEGNDVDFNVGLYFYEKLCKHVLEDADGKKWRDDPKYKPSLPVMMTALVRKQELREKVDVNFDGRISFLEYLLYQYRAYANPADFTKRSMAQTAIGEHPEIVKARRMLEEVSKAIRAYEEEKTRLNAEEKKGGVKGLGAKHQLSILGASPLGEQLNTSLIKAEAAVRIAGRKFGATGSFMALAPGDRTSKATDGSLWWLSRDLSEKKLRYGRKD